MNNNKIVITDTSCFILLSRINALDILQKLFSIVYTTPQIAAEYGEPLPFWVYIQTVQNDTLLKNYQKKVDPGEASALALAVDIQADLVILDDLAARKLAQQLGIAFKGTLGLLVMAKQDGVIDRIRPYLEKIRHTNFRVADYVIEQTLKEAGE